MIPRPGDLLATARRTWAANPATVRALVASSFVNRVGTLVVPFLAFYLSSDRGLSAARVGAFVSVYGIGAIVGGLAGGVLTDRLTARDALNLAQLVSALAAVGLVLARADWSILVSLAAFGVASQAGRPPFSALIASAVPADRRLGAFQLLGWVGTAGILIASALGTVAVQSLGYAVLFGFDGATTLAAAAIVRRLVPATPRRARAAAALRRTPWLDPLLVSTTALAFVGSALLTQAQVALPVSMHADGLTGTDFGLLVLVNGLAMIVLQAPLHAATKHLPLGAAAGLSTLIMGAGLGLNAFDRSAVAYIATALVWSVGETPLQGLTSTIPANIAPPDRRGRYQGVATLAPNGAAAVGPLLGGLGLQSLGKGAFWGTCALLGAAAAAGYWMVSARVGARSLELAGAAS